MSTLIPNSFSSYNLTDKETLNGSVLTGLQKQVVKNLQAVCAEEKLRLEFNPDNTSAFIQQEAYKRGQLDLLTYLLENSDLSEATLNDPNFEFFADNAPNKPKED